MHMSFWFSFDLGDFLFDGLIVASSAAFAVTCLILVLLAMGVEGLKTFRANRAKNFSMSSQANSSGRLLLGGETSALLTGLHLRGKIERIILVLSEVFLFLTQDCINWIIMLAVMGYNGYIFLSVLAGAGLGYGLFGKSLAYSKMESIKMKLQYKVCGECHVRDESAPGQSDPPSRSLPSSSGQHEVIVHLSSEVDKSVSAESQPLSTPD